MKIFTRLFYVIGIIFGWSITILTEGWNVESIGVSVFSTLVIIILAEWFLSKLEVKKSNENNSKSR